MCGSDIKNCLKLAFCLMILSVNAVNAKEYETDQDIIMIGDVHGAYDEMVSILRHSGLIDDNLDWVGGKRHFVSTGDLMDRGPSSRKIMDLLIKLQRQAEQQGGKLHVTLGNHEVLVMTGDWRYVSAAEYAEFEQEESAELRDKYYRQYVQLTASQPMSKEEFERTFVPGFFARLEAFLPSGIYGKWLHSLPFVIKINQHIFTHGGLSDVTSKNSLARLNRELHEQLSSYTESWQTLIQEDDLAAVTDYSKRYLLASQLRRNRAAKEFLGTTQALLYSSNSPTWYRGNVMCHPLFEGQVMQDALSKFDASVLWVGHTTARTVRQRFDQRLVVMDTGMLSEAYQGHPIYARITNGSMQPEDWHFVNANTGQPVSPMQLPDRYSINPAGMTDAETEAFLREADIVDIKLLGEGITKPKKVTLSKAGTTVHAVFKYFESGNERQASAREPLDRYEHEVAAYKLDRLLGLNLVPVSVKRQIDGQSGVLQLWIPNLINYRAMQDENVVYDGFCDYNRQRQMLDVFDYLIYNEDRNQSNITFTSDDWQLWAIDHTRTFSSETKRPKMLRKADLSLTPEFRQRLEQLQEPDLEFLSEWLEGRQVRALQRRIERLLNGKA